MAREIEGMEGIGELAMLSGSGKSGAVKGAEDVLSSGSEENGASRGSGGSISRGDDLHR